MALEFEWDASKAKSNVAKHGVTFDDAIAVFRDPFAKVFDDPDHSGSERRELIVGHAADGRLLVVTFTDRLGRIRVITARRATTRERQDYEQEAN